MPVQLIDLQAKYQELIKKAKENHVENLKDYLNLDEFFLQAKRREDANSDSLARQRVSDETYQDALAYVEKLLNETDDVIELDFVDETETNERKAEINKKHLEGFFSNKARIKEGAKHVAALDKNRPKSARYKKYFGWGLATTILGGLILAGLAVVAGLVLAPAMVATAALAAIAAIAIKVAGALVVFSSAVVFLSFVANAPEGLVFLALPFVPVLGPLIGGIYLLNKAHKLSKTREGLSLGLAKAFPALTKASHYNDKPTRELTQSTLTETIDAKIENAQDKLDEFEAALEQAPSEPETAYVTSAIEYYKNRVACLNEVKENKDANDTIRLLGRLNNQCNNTKDVNEKNALSPEVSLYREKVGRIFENAGKANKVELLARKETAEASNNDSDFMKSLPTVKRNDQDGRMRFFSYPHNLEYHDKHSKKQQPATPAAKK